MKFWKWFTIRSEGQSEERIREEYRLIPDKQLDKIVPDQLSALGLKVYREELERRKQLKVAEPREKR